MEEEKATLFALGWFVIYRPSVRMVGRFRGEVVRVLIWTDGGGGFSRGDYSNRVMLDVCGDVLDLLAVLNRIEFNGNYPSCQPLISCRLRLVEISRCWIAMPVIHYVRQSFIRRGKGGVAGKV